MVSISSGVVSNHSVPGARRFEPRASKRRMDRILDGSNPLDRPCFENDGVFKAASLLALLRNPLTGIARHGQSDLDWKSAVLPRYGGKGISVDDTRIV